MQYTRNVRSSISGGFRVPSQGNSWIEQESEIHSKNLQIKSGYQGRRKTHIITYNVRTLANNKKSLNLKKN